MFDIIILENRRKYCVLQKQAGERHDSSKVAFAIVGTQGASSLQNIITNQHHSKLSGRRTAPAPAFEPKAQIKPARTFK